MGLMHSAHFLVQFIPAVLASSRLEGAKKARDSTVITLSMRPTLLTFSGFRKCPGPVVQLKRARKSLDARS